MHRLTALSASLVLLAAAPAPAAVVMKGDISPRQIYQRVGPGVVLLLCVSKDGTGEMGTGSIIDDQGHVLTNAHVVVRESTRQPYEVLHVYLKPPKLTGDPKADLTDPIAAKVLNWDRNLDLALLQLEAKPPRYKIVPIGDASAVESGDPVVAIGHPEQGGLWTLTQGVVSTVIANLGGVAGKNAFQTDASINRGNSGGPLLDNRGSMIGVNTSMARKAKDGLTITSVNFAIKSDVVKGWLAQNGPGVRYTEPAPVQAEEKPAAAKEPPSLKGSSSPLPEGAEPPPAAPAPAEPQPAPKTETAPAPAPVQAEVKPAAPPAPPAETKPAEPRPAPQTETAPAKPKILTPVKPFRAEDLISKEISEMEDLEKEMQGEIDKRRQNFGQ